MDAEVTAAFGGIYDSLDSLNKKVSKLMSDVNSQQAELDSAVTTLSGVLSDIEAEVASLEAAAASDEPLDFTSLNALVASAQAADPGPQSTTTGTTTGTVTGTTSTPTNPAAPDPDPTPAIGAPAAVVSARIAPGLTDEPDDADETIPATDAVEAAHPATDTES